MPPVPPRNQPRPAVGSRSTLAPGKSDEELLQELKQAESAEAGKTARADQVHHESLQQDLNELAGMDLDFDVEMLLTDGSISKKNILLLEKPKALYCDMHTLTKGEDLLVERLIAEALGLRTMGREYTQARGTAIIAMAITRFNNAPYPNPDPLGVRDDAWQEKWDRKVSLFRTLIKSSTTVAEGLAIIYQNLGSPDTLDEDTKKKSPPPPTA